MPVKFKLSFILPGVFLFGLLACQKELTKEEYAAYIANPENGLRKDQSINDFELSVKYEPASYVVSQQEGLTLKEVAQFEHFQFRIKLTKEGNILLFKETPFQNEVTRINHFGFSAKNDFSIRTGKDTIPCQLAHYSRNYNLSPTIDLSLAFDAIPKENDWQLIYKDQQFNLGTVKFHFDAEDLQNVPALKH